MPSPFPGMDPYIEGDLFESFHGPFAVEIGRQLHRQLGPKYIALVERRVMADTPDEILISEPARKPDISVVREAAQRYSTALLDRPLKMVVSMAGTMTHYSIEIKEVAGRDLITAIEIISPANKRGKGRVQYLRKRERILDSDVNLVEIDLLQRGRRLPMEGVYPDYPYFVLIHRAATRPVADVWPISLEESLPRIPIPLSGEDDPVMVDLQDAMTVVFNDFRLEEFIDYSKAQPVPVRLANT